MESMKQIYLLLICQGFYLGSVCQRWTFPSRISAVFGSCVEVPCTYHPDGDSGTSNIIWYLYNNTNDLEILNTKDSSSVVDEYKGRTSLVPGENSCTLRIDPVRREDDGDIYYPGIAEDRNINAHKQNKAVLLNIDKVNIRLRGSMFLRKEGDATTIRCSVDHTCPSSPPSLKWNKPGQIKKRSVEISGGSWREESELKYFASYVDDGSRVLCTVIVPNGQNKSAASGPLNIQYAPKNVTVTMLGMQEMEESNVTLICNSHSNPDAHEYEWYKGETRLPDRGREITVWNITGSIESYYCVAINTVGRGESALDDISVPVQYEDSSNRDIILSAVIGAICLLLLVSLACFLWRKRFQKVTSNEDEKFQNVTYKNIMAGDMEHEYEELQILASPDPTYTDLDRQNAEKDYQQLKAESSTAGIYTALVTGDMEKDYQPLKSDAAYANQENGDYKKESEKRKAETSEDTAYTDLVSDDIEKGYQQLKVSIKAETSEETEYTHLKSDDIEKGYQQLKDETSADGAYANQEREDYGKQSQKVKAETSEDTAYTDLVSDDIEKEYQQLKPENSADIDITGGNIEVDSNYANDHQ